MAERVEGTEFVIRGARLRYVEGLRSGDPERARLADLVAELDHLTLEPDPAGRALPSTACASADGAPGPARRAR